MLTNRKQVGRVGSGGAKLELGTSKIPKVQRHVHKQAPGGGAAVRSKVGRFSVTFDRALNKEVRRAAGDNISAWMAEAAREQLRREAAAEFVRQFEEEHGNVSAEAIAEVEREWPR